MGEWVIGAFINFFGSIVINFGTNLLKLGHNERERLAMLDSDGTNDKLVLKPIIHFQTWRLGILFFALGNCLNFISFGYAAQSLLAALGSIQFVSNIAFTYFVFKKTVSGNVLVATAFIVLGNIFLVAFGNHQSPGVIKLLVAHWVSPLPPFKGILVSSIVHNWKEVSFSHPHCLCISPRWWPRPPGVLKLNFDGSALGNQGKAGVGGVIRDEDGIILSYSGPAVFSSINKAELLALNVGLREASHMNPQRSLVEGDSACVIQLALNPSTAPWYLADLSGDGFNV